MFALRRRQRTSTQGARQATTHFGSAFGTLRLIVTQRADYFVIEGGVVQAFFDEAGATSVLSDAKKGPLECARIIRKKQRAKRAAAPKGAAIAIDLDQKAGLIEDGTTEDEPARARLIAPLRAVWEREGFFLGWAGPGDIAAFAKLGESAEEDDDDDEEDDDETMPEVARIALLFTLRELPLAPLFAQLLNIPDELLDRGCWITWYEHDDFNRLLTKHPESPIDGDVAEATLSAVEFAAHQESVARAFAPELWDSDDALTVRFSFGFHVDLDRDAVERSLVEDGFSILRYSEWLTRGPAAREEPGTSWTDLALESWRWTKADAALLDHLVQRGRFDREAAAAWLANEPKMNIATDRHGDLRRALKARGVADDALDELTFHWPKDAAMCPSQLLWVANGTIDEVVEKVDKANPEDADAALRNIRAAIAELVLPVVCERWESAIESSEHRARFETPKRKPAKKARRK
jgi:hypothetical protein